MAFVPSLPSATRPGRQHMGLSHSQYAGWGPTMSLQVTRRTWAISLPVVYAGVQGSGWRSGSRSYFAAACPLGTARDGRCAPCSPASSKIHGVGCAALAGHLSSVTLDLFVACHRSARSAAK